MTSPGRFFTIRRYRCIRRNRENRVRSPLPFVQLLEPALVRGLAPPEFYSKILDKSVHESCALTDGDQIISPSLALTAMFMHNMAFRRHPVNEAPPRRRSSISFPDG